jgi:hemoglobin
MGEQSSLFERIGGERGVRALVDAFYRRVLADSELSPFFQGVSMEKLRNMQNQLFSVALEGPVVYTGRPISYAHDGLGIKPKHLQIFLEHFFETVSELGLSKNDEIEIIDRINLYADQVTQTASFSG